MVVVRPRLILTVSEALERTFLNKLYCVKIFIFIHVFRLNGSGITPVDPNPF